MKAFSVSLACCLLAAPSLNAQSPATPPPPPAAGAVRLGQLVVTASPFDRAPHEIVQPSSILGGRRLDLKLRPTLGETLGGEPGISSSYFGPGASRPIIRGLGGDRTRILNDGIDMMDASVVSPDHAVALDPLVVDRIETVRGPATLLYGGAAIGGVVNVIDSRIPRELAADAVAGRFSIRGGSAASERAAAGVVSGAAGPIAWQLDAFTRDTADVRIPGLAESSGAGHGDDDATRGRIPNTATRSEGAAAGASWIGADGFAGGSYSGFDTRYGVPGHEHDEHGHAVEIDLRQRRWDFAGEWRAADALVHTAKWKFGHGRYRHLELEDGAIGTSFSNRAYEGRVELLHRPLASLEGAIGVQLSRSDFAATGEEAFLPPTETTNRAVFVYEELRRTKINWQLGARLEEQQVTPAAVADLPSRSHTGATFAAGLVWKLTDTWSVAASGTHNERAPNAQELYANGPHAGTGSFEVGNARLGVERSRGLDLALRYASPRVTGELAMFSNRFAGYIFEERTGAIDAASGLPVYRFVQRDADFSGGELDISFHLQRDNLNKVDLRLTADWVRGRNRTADESLPRITPARVGAAVDVRRGNFTGTAEVQRYLRQDETAPLENPTEGFTLVSTMATWQLQTSAADIEFFVRATNLGNRVARLHTSFLKDIAPLPGRDLSAGVRFKF